MMLQLLLQLHYDSSPAQESPNRQLDTPTNTKFFPLIFSPTLDLKMTCGVFSLHLPALYHSEALQANSQLHSLCVSFGDVREEEEEKSQCVF